MIFGWIFSLNGWCHHQSVQPSVYSFSKKGSEKWQPQHSKTFGSIILYTCGGLGDVSFLSDPKDYYRVWTWWTRLSSVCQSYELNHKGLTGVVPYISHQRWPALSSTSGPLCFVFPSCLSAGARNQSHICLDHTLNDSFLSHNIWSFQLCVYLPNAATHLLCQFGFCAQWFSPPWAWVELQCGHLDSYPLKYKIQASCFTVIVHFMHNDWYSLKQRR